jgi:uncharacterized protein YgbK (DUF1537 family)
MNEDPRPKDELLRSLPAEWPRDLMAEIRERILASGRKVVVVDDDPTGMQTVHGVPILTEWSVETLCSELQDCLPAFFILTNSRSCPLAEARSINEAVGRNLLDAGKRTGRDFVVVSRSDSTLRGHFPGECEALEASLRREHDGRLIIPFFLEGGRFTVDDIHYVDTKGVLIPAGLTESARDSVFGYRSSNLREWVEEKTGGKVSFGQVRSITIDDIRRGGRDRVCLRLMELEKGATCVINAASYRDMEVFVLGLLEAEARGKRFLYRTAASFVRVRAGILAKPLLTPSELRLPGVGGGLVIVGSHVPRSTEQLHALLKLDRLFAEEMKVEAALDPQRLSAEIGRLAQTVDKALGHAQDVVVYTSRDLRTAKDSVGNLAIGRRVSDALVRLLKSLSSAPRYLIAKGGITACDLATAAMGVKRAMVLGQALPGVPVWRLGKESRFPGMPYIVFPGNVGGPEAVAEVVRMLREV